MSESEPPAVWWSPSLNTVITRGDHDHVYIDEHFALPADAVRLVPLVILPENFLTEHDADRFAAKMADIAGPPPDTGQARADRLADGIRRFADDCKLLLDFGGLDNRVARSIAQQERSLRALLAEPSGDTVQTPDAADLAYARSEVDKWLASSDPYCILPTRTEHIPALLARLDELEGTR